MKLSTIHRAHHSGYDIVTMASEGQCPTRFLVFNADGQPAGRFPSLEAALNHVRTLPYSKAASTVSFTFAQRATQLECLLQNVLFDPGFEHLRADTRKAIEEAIEGKAHG